MVKVRCQSCGSIGYTASPRFQSCECGGQFQVVVDEARDQSHQQDLSAGVFQAQQPRR